jgi:hypothetical protein
MRSVSTLAIALAAGALGAFSGCGQATGTPLSTVPVKGKVTYKGQPLTQGTIRFEPEGKGREASAEIQADGTYVLGTHKDADGAPPGAYRVAITGAIGTGSKTKIPAKYDGFSSSHLEAEVSAEKPEYPFDLK